jgi:hypothetical protein
MSGQKDDAKNAPKTMLDSIDTLIGRYHLLKHPFYQAWTEGTLSKESLQLYAAQYYRVPGKPEATCLPHKRQFTDTGE